MNKRRNISILAVVVVGLCAALSTARAQDSSTQPAPGNGQDSSQAQPSVTPPPQSTPPNPAYGQNGAAPIAENPPISALDQPALATEAFALRAPPAGRLQRGVRA